MGSLFRRSGTASWYMTYWDPIAHKWVQRSTSEKGEKQARKVLADMDAMQLRRAEAAGLNPGPLGQVAASTSRPRSGKHVLLVDAADAWIDERAEASQANHSNEVGHLRNHLLPELGTMPLTSIRPKHIRLWLRFLRSKPRTPGKGPKSPNLLEEEERLAPRTVRKVYGTVHKMFDDFVSDELISRTPCKIKREDLPPDVDTDPEWRDTAVYTMDEVQKLISDPRVPEHRRMYYAVSFLTGSRHGEAAALRFRHLDPTTEPLQKLLIARSYGGRTKTTVVKRVPVHPTLAAMLAEWKLGGYQRWVGRTWEPDDFIVPGPVPRLRKNLRGNATRMHSRHVAYHRLVEVDLKTLGYRHRRVHDMRHTFITLTTDAGAEYDVVKLITHAPPRGTFDRYQRVGWKRLCDAVLCMDVRRRSGGEGVG
ncbi:MAG: hypothetical protein V3V08_00575 [Nannocystaceae bacterium]